MNVIKLKNIHKTYGKDSSLVEALKGVSLNVEKGEMLAIMGKSGSGKSTLLNIMGTLETMDSGEYIYGHKVLDFNSQSKLSDFRCNKIGFIVQNFSLINDYSVYGNVVLPLKYNGIPKKEQKEKVHTMLEKLEIENKADKYPYQLSGGECQRVAIARAIINEPEMILADEPTGSLDEQTESVILDILCKLNKEEKTIVIVTHDSNVARVCNRIINLKDGIIIEDDRHSDM